MRQWIAAVDPGFQGGIAIYDPIAHKLIAAIPMPLLPKIDNKKKLIDSGKLAEFLKMYERELAFVVVEAAGSHPGQSVSAMFRYGYGAGIIEGIFAAKRIPIKFIYPAVWKQVLGLSPDKEKSLVLARKLFPDKVGEFSRKKDDGVAEAALMAYLGGLMMKSGAMDYVSRR